MDLFGSICLSDIPKHLIQTSEKNGKKYLTICINQRKSVDEYGNTHFVKAYKKADPGDPQNYYLGNLKESKYNADTAQQQTAAPAAQTQTAAPTVPLPQAEGDDLPF